MDRKSSLIMGLILFVFIGFVALLIGSQFGNNPGNAVAAEITPIPMETLKSSTAAAPTLSPSAAPTPTQAQAAATAAPPNPPAASPSFNESVITIYNAWDNMIKANGWLGLASYLCVFTLLADIYLVMRLFKYLSRPGCSGYIGIAAGILLLVVVFFAASLPEPFPTLFKLGYGIYLIWLFISWIISFFRPKVVVSAYSQTNSIKISPYCLFCGKPTTNIMHHTIEKNSEENGVKSYSKAVYPFAAHPDCYDESLKGDKMATHLCQLLMAIDFAIMIVNVFILYFSGLLTTPDSSYMVVVVPLFAIIIPVAANLVEFRTDDLIKNYCARNTQ